MKTKVEKCCLIQDFVSATHPTPEPLHTLFCLPNLPLTTLAT